MIFIVIVQYGDQCTEVIKKFIEKFSDDINLEFVIIRTDCNNKKSTIDINEAFEFSGYQEGLRIVAGHPFFLNNDGVKIIFINDTAFTSHLKFFHFFIFKCLLKIFNEKEYKVPSVLGIFQKNFNLPFDKPLINGYMPTWIFAISASKLDLKNINFYNGSNHYKFFIEKEFDSLSLNYRSEINNWLIPKNFFSGWYKALQSGSQSSETLNRKRFTIYLEHTMLKNFLEIGFLINPIARQISCKANLLYIHLIIFDRLFINFLKFKFRLVNKFS